VGQETGTQQCAGGGEETQHARFGSALAFELSWRFTPCTTQHWSSRALSHSTDINQTHRGARRDAVHTLLAVYYNMATEVDVAKRLDFAADLSDALPRAPQRDSVLQALAEPSLANLHQCAHLQAPLHTATHLY